MRIAVTGATGLIGRRFVERARAEGEELVVLSRDGGRAAEQLGRGVEVHEWRSPTEEPAPAEALRGANAVVHLLGEPVAQRWSAAAKRRIRDSRVLATEQLIAGVAGVTTAERPATLVSQSATGYYGPRDAQPVDETAAPGADFLAEVVVEWEGRARGAGDLGLRVVLTRTGVVLASGGGALATMLPPFKLGVGGPVAGGRQYVPWIHLDDVVGALLRCVRDDALDGPVNLVAPEPATNRELSKALGRVLHRPAVLPVPAAAIRLLYGEMASIVTTGVNAVPARLQQAGYAFAQPALEQALQDVLR
jgi:uncharacterized protein (TIGR01777 family)